MPDPLIGQTVGGCEIVSLLGRGGMSTIYLAHQKSVNREVALKILSGALLGDPTFMTRFTREVETTARLQHPHILPIFDFGEHDGQPFIVMAYLPGGALSDLIEYGPLELDTTARLVRQVSTALDFAHGHGVIHRDIKPANILLDSQQNAILTDFGVAHVIAATRHLTRDEIIGTPSYLAPEMLSTHDEISPSADVYSLGITLYQMLAGELPFVADTAAQLMWSHVNDPAPLIAPQRADLPPEIDAVLQKALAKTPGSRYTSPGDLAADLDAVSAGKAPNLARAEAAGKAVLSAHSPEPPGRYPGRATGDIQQAVALAMDQVVKILRPDGVSGSGVYLPGGQALTCNHVVEGGQGVYVRFHTGEQIEADVLAADPKIDLALLSLRVEPDTLGPEQLSGISLVRGAPSPGEELVAIGHPLGLDWSVTGGHYNALRQPGQDPLPRFGINLACPLVQVDVAINPGNSGGPILDSAGRLVGIADSVVNPAVANNIGFAIDAATALDFWGQHRDKEEFLAPYTCGHHHPKASSYCALTGKPVKLLEIIPMPTHEGVRYSCGHVHPAGLHYCLLTGKPTAELDELPPSPSEASEASAAPAAEVTCTNCGFTYSTRQTACPQCGKPRRM